MTWLEYKVCQPFGTSERLKGVSAINGVKLMPSTNFQCCRNGVNCTRKQVLGHAGFARMQALTASMPSNIYSMYAWNHHAWHVCTWFEVLLRWRQD